MSTEYACYQAKIKQQSKGSTTLDTCMIQGFIPLSLISPIAYNKFSGFWYLPFHFFSLISSDQSKQPLKQDFNTIDSMLLIFLHLSTFNFLVFLLSVCVPACITVRWCTLTNTHTQNEAVKATQCGKEAKFTVRGSGTLCKGHKNTHTCTTGRITLYAYAHILFIPQPGKQFGREGRSTKR